MQPFTTKGVIGESWKLFKENWSVLWGALFIVFVVNVLFSMVSKEMKDMQAVVSIISLVSFVVGRWLQLGLGRLSLSVVDGKPATVNQLFAETKLLARFIAGSILYGLIVIVGILLLIVPGIMWGIKYGYFMFGLLEKDLGIWESFEWSAKITDGVKMKLFGVSILVGLLVLVSIIPFGLGLIATVPMALLVSVLLYRRMTAREGGASSATPATPTPVPTPTAQPFVSPAQ